MDSGPGSSMLSTRKSAARSAPENYMPIPDNEDPILASGAKIEVRFAAALERAFDGMRADMSINDLALALGAAQYAAEHGLPIGPKIDAALGSLLPVSVCVERLFGTDENPAPCRRIIRDTVMKGGKIAAAEIRGME